MVNADGNLLRKLGEVLYDGELDHGWQREVAVALNVSDSTVSDIVRGRRKMSQEVHAAVIEKLEELRS